MLHSFRAVLLFQNSDHHGLHCFNILIILCCNVSGLYYCFNIVIIMLSVFLSSLVVHFNKQTAKDPPRWMKVVSYVIMIYSVLVYVFKFSVIG